MKAKKKVEEAQAAIAPTEVAELKPHLVPVAGGPATGSDVPFVTVNVQGRELKLALEFSQMAKAENQLRRAGKTVLVMLAMSAPGTLASTQTMFAAGLYHFHPEISYEDACAMLDLPHALIVGSVIWQYITKDLPPVAPVGGGTDSAEVGAQQVTD